MANWTGKSPLPTFFKITNYISVYPIQDTDHVKATSTAFVPTFQPWYATDPNKSLIGSADVGVTWTGAENAMQQRFHIDLGSPEVIKRIYHEGFHHYGTNTIAGPKDFTFLGTNNVDAFNELTYGIDTGWTQLTTEISEFAEHAPVDASDPHYILVNNSVPYRYYAFKFANNRGYTYLQLRRVELQKVDTETIPTSFGNNVLIGGTASASSSYGTRVPEDAVDRDYTNVSGGYWSTNVDAPGWWKYDLGVGVTKKVNQVKFWTYWDVLGAPLKGFEIHGSNDDSNWKVLFVGQAPNEAIAGLTYNFRNTNSYRYYRVYFSSSWRSDGVGFYEVEMREGFDYTSIYPTIDSDHIKVTSQLPTAEIYLIFNPEVSVTGTNYPNISWYSNVWNTGEQRIHVDLGSSQIIKKINYENGHNSGGDTNTGAKDFTLWGSNSVDSFNELTYGVDTGWTQITTDVSQFDQHIAQDMPDPKCVFATNNTAYRYYAIKIANNWGNGSYVTMRKIELQK